MSRKRNISTVRFDAIPRSLPYSRSLQLPVTLDAFLNVGLFNRQSDASVMFETGPQDDQNLAYTFMKYQSLHGFSLIIYPPDLKPAFSSNSDDFVSPINTHNLLLTVGGLNVFPRFPGLAGHFKCCDRGLGASQVPYPDDSVVGACGHLITVRWVCRN